MMQTFYQEELSRFSDDPEGVINAIEVGKFPLIKENVAPETVALMQVIVALYNLEEAITKT